VLTNESLTSFVDTSNEWIVSRTGIAERRILERDRRTSDLAIEAARRALEAAGVCPERVDLIIVATSTPDTIFPATASLVQHSIGATRAGAFDLSAACSGLIYGMAVGAQFVMSGMYETVVVIGAETMSRLLDWSDRSTCVLFGDGASAVVIQPCAEGHGFLSFCLGSDGSGADLLKVEWGGGQAGFQSDLVTQGSNVLRMAGKEVFRFAVNVIGTAAARALEQAGLTMDDVDLFIPHQANIRIIDTAAKRMGISPDKTFSNVEKYGNTSAASVGIALSEAVDAGRLKPGDTALLVGFGAGLTWGATVLRW
jgi:3-oxoacyl-[acyl-carrier-protein] synthase-3